MPRKEGTTPPYERAVRSVLAAQRGVEVTTQWLREHFGVSPAQAKRDLRMLEDHVPALAARASAARIAGIERNPKPPRRHAPKIWSAPAWPAISSGEVPPGMARLVHGHAQSGSEE